MVGRPDHHSLLLALFVVQLGLTFRLLLRPEPRPGAGRGRGRRGQLLGQPRGRAGDRRHPRRLRLLLAAGRSAHEPDQPGLHARDHGQRRPPCGDRARPRAPGDRESTGCPWSMSRCLPASPASGCWSRAPSAAAGRPGPGAPRGPSKASRSTPFPCRDHRQGLGGLGGRLGIALLGMAVIGVGMPALFPSLRAGPLGPVDPLYEHLRLQQIVEYQPLIPGAWLSAGRFEEIAQRAVRIMGIALAALPFLIVMLARSRPERRAWVALALALVVFLPIACEEVHFGDLCPGAAGHPLCRLRRLADRPDRDLAGAGDRSAPASPAPGRRAVLALGVADALPEASIATAGHDCPIDAGGAGPDPPRRRRPQDRAHLHRLRARAALRHPSAGALDPEPPAAARLRHDLPHPGANSTRRRPAPMSPATSIDWILLCPSTAERRQFAHARDDPRTLYRRLIDGAPPPWLRPATRCRRISPAG